MFGRNAETYREWKELEHYYSGLSGKAAVCNLGSTISKKDFEYSLWNRSGLCLATMPQTVWYDGQMLRQFAPYLQKGAKMCVCVCFFTFLVDFYGQDSANYKYYFILDKSRIRGYCAWKKLLLRTVPCLLMPSLLKQEVKRALATLLGEDNLKKLLGRGKDSCKKESGSGFADESDRQRATQWIQGWYREFGWDERAELTSEQKATVDRVFAFLEDTLEFGKEQGFVPVLVVPPVSPNMKALLPEKVLEECFWKYIERLSGQGYHVVDLYHSELFSDAANFEDAYALNTKGKEIFNGILNQEI